MRPAGGKSPEAVRIRPARAGDIPAIARIVVASWRHVFAGLLPAAYLAALSEERQHHRHARLFATEGVVYRVAESAEGVIGFA